MPKRCSCIKKFNYYDHNTKLPEFGPLKDAYSIQITVQTSIHFILHVLLMPIMLNSSIYVIFTKPVEV